MSPASSGSSGSDVECVAAADLLDHRDRRPVEPESHSGCRGTQRGRPHGPRARVHRGRERPEALDLHHRRPTGPGLLVGVGRRVDVDERLQPRVGRGELGVREQGGLVQRQHATPFEQRLRAGTCRCRGVRRCAGPGSCDRRRRATAGHRRRATGSATSSAASTWTSRTTRRTKAGCISGRSTAQTAATAARPAAAARPVAMPCSGPRPATGSSTTSTRGGRLGSACPGARTTRTGPSDRPQGEHPHRSVQQC